jgi:hemin uptake protein HemP
LAARDLRGQSPVCATYLAASRALLFSRENTMQGIKSREGKSSVSLCNCSRTQLTSTTATRFCISRPSLGAVAGQIRAAIGNQMRETRLNFVSHRSTVPNVSLLTEKKARIESKKLFQGKSEIIIVHQNEEYNLRITRNGKLILTK